MSNNIYQQSPVTGQPTHSQPAPNPEPVYAREPQQQPPPDRKVWFESAFIRFGAIVGVIASIAGVIFLFWPDLKPEPTPPAVAKITEIVLEENVMLETYFERDKRSISDYSIEEQKNIGVLVTPRLELQGLKDHSVSMQWQLFDANENRQVPTEWTPSRLLFPIPAYKPAQNQDVWLPTNWLPMPNADAKVFIRFKVVADLNGQSKTLGYADTEPFELSFTPPGIGLPPQVPYTPDKQVPKWHPATP